MRQRLPHQPHGQYGDRLFPDHTANNSVNRFQRRSDSDAVRCDHLEGPHRGLQQHLHAGSAPETVRQFRGRARCGSDNRLRDPGWHGRRVWRLRQFATGDAGQLRGPRDQWRRVGKLQIGMAWHHGGRSPRVADHLWADIRTVIIKLRRTRQNQVSTVGDISVEELPVCDALEDAWHMVKMPGITRIPAGLYEIRLRTEGGMHAKYAERFLEFHKGMLWLQ